MSRTRLALAALAVLLFSALGGAGVAFAQEDPAPPSDLTVEEAIAQINALVCAEVGTGEQLGRVTDLEISLRAQLGIGLSSTESGRLSDASSEKANELSACPQPGPSPSPGPEPTPTTTAPPTTTTAPSTDSSFENCDEARAAGATPLLLSQPGYESRLDIDGDGIACEDVEGLTGSTPNNDQVTVMPDGGVDTGDGSTR